jgi:hypothetical protein
LIDGRRKFSKGKGKRTEKTIKIKIKNKIEKTSKKKKEITQINPKPADRFSAPTFFIFTTITSF